MADTNPGSDTYQHTINILNQLVEISLVMNSTQALHPLLDQIMQASISITGAEAASILLMDRHTRELRFAAAIGSTDTANLAGIIVPLENSIAGRIIEEDRALVIDDVSRDPGHFQEVDRQISFVTRSLLGVPMRIKQNLVGVLEVLNKTDGTFTEEDIRYITILASQAAIAIENAQLITALRDAYDEVNKLDKLKSDFIAIASHELRTPLGIILGYASFLQEESVGELGNHAQAVMDSALHLRSIIDSMSNLRYVQIEESLLEKNRVSVSSVIRLAKFDVKTMAVTKEVELLLDELDETLFINADPMLLAMALTNILNNAITFTPSGGHIRVSASRRIDEVWIQVQDTGLGIPEEELERIFEQFYQVEDPMTRQHNGLGLGLAIARAVVERHRGRVWAESEGLGKGSLFTIALPLI